MAVGTATVSTAFVGRRQAAIERETATGVCRPRQSPRRATVDTAFMERRQAAIAGDETAEERRLEQSLVRARRGRRAFGMITAILVCADAYLGSKATYAYMYPVYNLISIALTTLPLGITYYLHTKVADKGEELANARRQ